MTEDLSLSEIKKLAYDIATQKKDVENHLKKCQNMYETFKANLNDEIIIGLAETNLHNAEDNLIKILTIESRMEQILRRITP